MKEWILAQPFIEWLEAEVGEDEIIRAKHRDPTFARRLHRWTKESTSKTAVNVYDADKWLVKHFPNADLTMIPAEFYVDKPRAPHSPKVRREALRLHRQGLTHQAVAERLEVARDTVAKWVYRERVKAR